MKKTHNGKQVPFFHIFNKLSDSISFTQRLFLSFIFIAVPVMAALFIGSFLFLQSSIFILMLCLKLFCFRQTF